jgi:hypothetical protein
MSGYPETNVTHGDWEPAPWWVRIWGYSHFRRKITWTFSHNGKTFSTTQWDYY